MEGDRGRESGKGRERERMVAKEILNAEITAVLKLSTF